VPPDITRSTRDFATLLSEFANQDFDPYGFNDRENWVRAAERALWLVNNLPVLQKAGAIILEVGAGDGMLGGLLEGYGHHVTLSDHEDWRDGRAMNLPLVLGKLEDGLGFPNDWFDAIISYNSFEHFEDPARCAAVLTRVVKPGGTIHLDFGPLFASPFGMHCHLLLPIPYCQFLFEESLVLDQVARSGLSDLGRKMFVLQPMNRWRLRQFETTFTGLGCRVVGWDVFHDFSRLRVVLRYPEAFSGRGLTVDDLTGYRLRTTLEKPNSLPQ
jgi:SAM-dependent methyltransferase